jgi:hypothetical protein
VADSEDSGRAGSLRARNGWPWAEVHVYHRHSQHHRGPGPEPGTGQGPRMGPERRVATLRW